MKHKQFAILVLFVMIFAVVLCACGGNDKTYNVTIYTNTTGENDTLVWDRVTSFPQLLKKGYCLEGLYLDEGMTTAVSLQDLTKMELKSDINVYVKWTLCEDHADTDKNGKCDKCGKSVVTIHPNNGEDNFVLATDAEFPELTRIGYEDFDPYGDHFWLDEEGTKPCVFFWPHISQFEVTFTDLWVGWNECEYHTDNDADGKCESCKAVIIMVTGWYNSDRYWNVAKDFFSSERVDLYRGYVIDSFYTDRALTQQITPEEIKNLTDTVGMHLYVKWVECPEHVYPEGQNACSKCGHIEGVSDNPPPLTECKKHAVGKYGMAATCLRKAVCGKCGKEFGEFAAHSYVDGKCKWCGIAEPIKDAEVFFDGLLASSKAIGSTQVTVDRNFNMHFAGSVELGIGDTIIPASFDIQMFVDRENAGASSAMKVVLSVLELKAELLLFVDDNENIYVKIAPTTEWETAKMQVVPLQLMQADGVTTWNSCQKELVVSLFENVILANKKTIIENISWIVSSFGPDFSVNTFVNVMLDVIGINVSGLAENKTVAQALESLGINIKDGVDVKEVLMAIQNLAIDAARYPQGLTVVTNKGTLGTIGGYKGQVNMISGGVSSLVNMILPAMLSAVPELSGLFANGCELWLGYESANNGDIEKLWFEAVIIGDAVADEGPDKNIRVKLTIDKFGIENVASPSFADEKVGAEPLTVAFKTKLNMPERYLAFAEPYVNMVRNTTGVDLGGLSIGGKVEIEGHFDVVSLALDGYLDGTIQIKFNDVSTIVIELVRYDTVLPMTSGIISIDTSVEQGQFIAQAIVALLSHEGATIDQIVMDLFPTAQEGFSGRIVSILSGEGPLYTIDVAELGVYGNLSEMISNLYNASSHEHRSTPENSATCQKNAVCEECGNPYGKRASHDYGVDGKCKWCGETKPAARTEAYVNVVKLLNYIMAQKMITNEGEYGLVIDIKNPGDIFSETYIAKSILDQIDNVNDGWYEKRTFDEANNVIKRERIEKKDLTAAMTTGAGLEQDDGFNWGKKVTVYGEETFVVTYYYCRGLNDFLSKDCGLGRICDGKLSTLLSRIKDVKVSITKDGVVVSFTDNLVGGYVSFVANLRFGTSNIDDVPTK